MSILQSTECVRKLSRQYALMVIFIVMTLRTSEITVTPTKIDGNI